MIRMEEKALLVDEYLTLAVEYANLIMSAEQPDLERKAIVKVRLNETREKLGMEPM